MFSPRFFKGQLACLSPAAEGGQIVLQGSRENQPSNAPRPWLAP